MTAPTPPRTPASAGSATTGGSTSSTGSRGRATRAPSSTELERALARALRRSLPADARPSSAAPSSRRRAHSPRPSGRSPSCARCWATRPVDPVQFAACSSSSRCAWARRRSPTACRSPHRRRSGRAASRPSSAAGSRRASSRAAPSPEPFLSDEDRRAIATASGLVLPVREDRLDRERYLFYVCASRAERLLVLSSRSSDEEGNPQTRVVLRGRRARAARRTTPSCARARCPRSPGAPRTRPPRRSGTARTPRPARAGRRRQAGPLSSEPLLAELSRATPWPPARSRTSPTAR